MYHVPRLSTTFISYQGTKTLHSISRGPVPRLAHACRRPCPEHMAVPFAVSFQFFLGLPVLRFVVFASQCLTCFEVYRHHPRDVPLPSQYYYVELFLDIPFN